MPGYVDQDGNEVDINKILTIIAPIAVTGDQGTEMYFLYLRQYEFDSTEYRLTYYDGCDIVSTQRMMLHYKIVWDTDEVFYIPGCFAVVEGKLRKSYEQDVNKWYEMKSDQPKDVVKAYKKATGIDLSKTHNVKHNGVRAKEKADKISKKTEKIPGGYEEDPADEQTY